MRVNLAITLCALMCLVLASHPSKSASEVRIENGMIKLTNLFRPEDELSMEVKGFAEDAGKGEHMPSGQNKNPNSRQGGLTWSIYFPSGEWIKLSEVRLAQSVSGAREYRFTWKINSPSEKKQICFPQPDETYKSMWFSTLLSPKEKQNYLIKPSSYKYVDLTYNLQTVSPVVEHLLINGVGFAILLDDVHPWALHLDHKSGYGLCIFNQVQSQDWASSVQNMDHRQEYFWIKFRILVAADPQAVWRNAVGDYFRYIHRPVQSPHADLFKRSIWPVESFQTSSQPNWRTTIDELIKETDNSLFPVHIFINNPEKWKLDQGFIEFDMSKFEDNVKQGVDKFLEKIRANGRNLISVEFSPLQSSTIANNIGDKSKQNFQQYVTDFSQAQEMETFVQSLLQFCHQTKINTLGYTRGDVNGFCAESDRLINKPDHYPFVASDDLVKKYPNFITTQFTDAASRVSHDRTMLDFGYKTQRYPTVVRVKISYHVTKEAIAMQQLIPSVLTASLAGYQYILAEFDSNFSDELSHASADSSDDKLKTLERFYIRWIQAICLLPAISIPTLPWEISTSPDLSRKAANVVRQCFSTREAVLFEGRVPGKDAYRDKAVKTLSELANDWMRYGEPIIRPMWFANASDPNLLEIVDQFMIGDMMIVAPMLDVSYNEESRSVYLPYGSWWCYSKQQIYEGREKPWDFNVDYDELLYFVRS